MTDINTDKKKIILDAAEELFARYGYDATSTREIAEKAGANVAMISYYFGSKENLLNAIIERYSREVLDRIKSSYNAGLSPSERLAAMATDYLEYSLSHPNPIIIAHRELGVNLRAELQGSIQETVSQIREMITEIVNDGQKLGIYREVDVQLFIHAMGSMVDCMIIEMSSMKHSGMNLDCLGVLDIDSNDSKERLRTFYLDIVERYLRK